MTSKQNKARSKKKTTADAVVFRYAASAAMPPRQASARLIKSISSRRFHKAFDKI